MSGFGSDRGSSWSAMRHLQCQLRGSRPGANSLMRPIRHLQERKRPVSPRGDQEVLPSGGRDESLQPVVFIVDAVLSNQVERSLVSAHPGEEVGGWHEDCELQFRLSAAV